jgi:hypothetical protein
LVRLPFKKGEKFSRSSSFAKKREREITRKSIKNLMIHPSIHNALYRSFSWRERTAHRVRIVGRRAEEGGGCVTFVIEPPLIIFKRMNIVVLFTWWAFNFLPF